MLISKIFVRRFIHSLVRSCTFTHHQENKGKVNIENHYENINEKLPFYHLALNISTFIYNRNVCLMIFKLPGQPIDGPENGPPPEPWSIVVPIPALFQGGQRKMEVPHTAHVRECGRCVGNCKVRCESCYGRGGVSGTL